MLFIIFDTICINKNIMVLDKHLNDDILSISCIKKFSINITTRLMRSRVNDIDKKT